MAVEVANIALVQLCVDDRLDHPRIRASVEQKMRDIYLRADRIFLLNEVGGNFGQNFRNTLDVFLESGARVVFCAVLHHDDCAADKAGRRLPMEQTVAELSRYLVDKRVAGPVYTGFIRTADSFVEWQTGESRQIQEAA
jgi:hypothetical protein